MCLESVPRPTSLCPDRSETCSNLLEHKFEQLRAAGKSGGRAQAMMWTGAEPRSIPSPSVRNKSLGVMSRSVTFRSPFAARTCSKLTSSKFERLEQFDNCTKCDRTWEFFIKNQRHTHQLLYCNFLWQTDHKSPSTNVVIDRRKFIQNRFWDLAKRRIRFQHGIPRSNLLWSI